MKRLILVLGLLWGVWGSAAGADTLFVSVSQTVHLRFASELKYVNLGSRVLVAKMADGARDFLAVKDKPELVVFFQEFYPDYVMVKGSGPSTQSMLPKNPGYLYRVYYENRMLGMNVLEGSEELTIDEYTAVFENPRNYTLLAVKRDRFTWLVFIGGVITLLGLVLAFYLRPAAFCAAEDTDGTWRVYAQSRKGGALFREAFEKAAGECGFKLTGE